MAFLYEKIDALKEFGTYAELPLSVSKNLKQSFELRPYQKDAFCNFITYKFNIFFIHIISFINHNF